MLGSHRSLGEPQAGILAGLGLHQLAGAKLPLSERKMGRGEDQDTGKLSSAHCLEVPKGCFWKQQC